MWYFEELRVGVWHPRTSWGAPKANPHQNDRPANRNIVHVAAEHEALGLDEISAIYGARETTGAET